MAKATIDPSKLGDALREQLGLLHADIVERVDAEGEKSIKQLVKLTKASVPTRHGDFKRAITYKVVPNPTGCKQFVWGARAPLHRLTHLLVHGHQKVNGGRVDGDPFLEKSLDTVLPEYEKNVEEALRND